MKTTTRLLRVPRPSLRLELPERRARASGPNPGPIACVCSAPSCLRLPNPSPPRWRRSSECFACCSRGLYAAHVGVAETTHKDLTRENKLTTRRGDGAPGRTRHRTTNAPADAGTLHLPSLATVVWASKCCAQCTL